jgi:nucleotide-binding universal stress UspA family protein/DNA-binding NarL/FixJ family response regulator
LDKFKNIVCPVNFSDSSKLALNMAVETAILSEGKVALVHIVSNPWSNAYWTEEIEALTPPKAKKRADEMLREFAKEHADKVEFDYYTECMLDVAPEKGVMNFARFYGADLIIMAKKEDFRRSKTGGFTENVMRGAHCSVLVLRSHELFEKDILKDKHILVVDDEPDVLETVSEMLPMCWLHTASDYDTALEYLNGHNYDIVVLDIMGVNGFALLERCVELNFPAVMLTAHAVTPEAIKKSMQLGAAFFLPKERMVDLQAFLEEVVIGGGKPIWNRFVDRMDSYFERLFGREWEKTKEVLQDLEKSMGK